MGQGEERKARRRGGAQASSDLLVEPQGEADQDQFRRQMEESLSDTAQAVIERTGTPPESAEGRSWQRARQVVADFRPIPWFIWRLSNFVFSRPGRPTPFPEGFVFGLRRLLCAVASDETLGTGSKVTEVRRALTVVPPDVIAAAAVIHAVCRRLVSRPHERIWRPILDDALLRAQIGHEVGGQRGDFGAGRGMLGGFAGRIGLAVLIAAGNADQAQRALEMLATGAGIAAVGLRIYECDPLQVSAMMLSACGCGRDAAFGTAAFASRDNPAQFPVDSELQGLWLATLNLTEHVRMNRPGEIPGDHWSLLGFEVDTGRERVLQEAKQSVRRGHGWSWMI